VQIGLIEVTVFIKMMERRTSSHNHMLIQEIISRIIMVMQGAEVSSMTTPLPTL
jgi:hypothetical protein